MHGHPPRHEGGCGQGRPDRGGGDGGGREQEAAVRRVEPIVAKRIRVWDIGPIIFGISPVGPSV